jgi:hypothetical protein
MMLRRFLCCAIIIFTIVIFLSACESQTSQQAENAGGAASPTPKITATFTVRPTRAALPTAPPMQESEGANKPYPTATSSGDSTTSILQVQVKTAAKAEVKLPGRNAPCYQATFLKNITVADGAGFQPDSPILKVWQVQNSGSCAWSSKTVLTFAHGVDFNAPPSIPLNTSVPSGAIVDISLNLKSPLRSGTYQGFWKPQNEMGVPIEMLNSPASELALKIVVFIPESPEPGLTYDFTSNFCMAEWSTPLDLVDCPSVELAGANGAVMRSYTPILENMSKDNEPALMVLPSEGKDGFISGIYPEYAVKEGDRFKTVIGCLQKVPKCRVIFELNYTEDGKTAENLLTWEETYDGRFKNVDLSLDSLKGKTVQFILRVGNAGDAVDDQVFWLWPRISNPNATD